MTLLVHSLDYLADSAAYFHSFADEPWSLFLDSGQGSARYDIIAARPIKVITTSGQLTVIDDNVETFSSTEDPFDLLRGQINIEPNLDTGDWPFAGGAIGYFGYDLGRRIETLPEIHPESDNFPDLAFGIYNWAVVVDHISQRAALLAHKELIDQESWSELRVLFDQIDIKTYSTYSGEPLELSSEVQAIPDKDDYHLVFDRVQSYIREGDCYQINLARCYQAKAKGDAWFGYRKLRQISPVPYGAFFRIPGGSLLSVSPERFLTLKDNRVTTSPIKGTRPRHLDTDKDDQLRSELQNSAKDRAENLMIVDLLRNDLGRSCQIGSIKVDDLFRVETFPTVHHLVSDISGDLAQGEDALSLMRSCFPGGSITGAPKVRAMQIIEELEPRRRGPYCGSMAYIGFDGSMDSNILIRTLMQFDDDLWFWAGGGVVADSIEEDEFLETQHKARAILEMLNG